MMKRKITPQEDVCIFFPWLYVVVHMFVCSRARKGVCDGGGQG